MTARKNVTTGGSLRSRILHAGKWAMGGHMVAQVIRLGSNLVMTRLLIPEMFGIMAIATMTMVILNLLSDIGIKQNIVQSRRGDDPAFLDTAWVVQIGRGFGLWTVAILISGGLYLAAQAGLFMPSSVYASPQLPPVIIASSFAAVILGFQSTKIATAHRHFDQKRLTKIELFSQLTALAVMLVLGVTTRSIWALISGGLVSALTTTVLSHVLLNGHKNHFRREREALKELFEFGKWVFVSSSVGVLAMYGDRLLLGGLVTAQELGFYAIATLIVSAITEGMNRLYSRVLLPALSEIARNEPGRLCDVYYKLSLPADLLLLFLTGLLFESGQWVVELLYDPRYSDVGKMLEILSLSLFAARYGVAQQLYLAVGKPSYLSVINIARFITLCAVVPLLYRLGGTHAAIWGIALHTLVTIPIIYRFNALLGLLNFRRELRVLPALPLGFCCGFAINWAHGVLVG